MSEIGLADLTVLAELSGNDLKFDETVRHVEFDLMGADSLSLLDLVDHIKLRYQVSMSDEEILSCRTPDGLLKLVNSRLP